MNEFKTIPAFKYKFEKLLGKLMNKKNKEKNGRRKKTKMFGMRLGFFRSQTPTGERRVCRVVQKNNTAPRAIQYNSVKKRRDERREGRKGREK